MFGKEKKDKSLASDFDDSDIFADFSWDKKLKEEVQEFEKEQKRDLFDILNIFSWLFRTVNLLLFVLIFIWVWYTYIQKDETFSNSTIIDPLCFIFVWDDNIKEKDLCSSITYTSNFYKNKVKELKDRQFKEVFSIIGDVYKSENFINSRDVIFLKDNFNKRLKPTEILNSFNKLLSDFNINKKSITCDNISIDKDSILQANCTSYKNWWTDDVNWLNFDNKKYFWSSISLASSFLDYVSRSNTNFSLLEKQKDFSSESDSWSLDSSTTKFSLKLKYITNNLSL